MSVTLNYKREAGLSEAIFCAHSIKTFTCQQYDTLYPTVFTHCQHLLENVSIFRLGDQRRLRRCALFAGDSALCCLPRSHYANLRGAPCVYMRVRGVHRYAGCPLVKGIEVNLVCTWGVGVQRYAGVSIS